ncbi:MAG TPA: SagB/ThcOx family dehydrogenase [Sedimentisphaerales bacterium]|nr:SagB/ThcOx family dehydrogenase [Sedimentisphaerales bacterium]
MDRRTFVKTVPAMAVLAGATEGLAQESAKPAAELQPIVLPKPQKDGGKSVLAALWERRTVRNIRSEKLPPQMLSNLLWAAFGVNREQGNFGKPGRTAPSASNSQEIDLYVALPEGVYVYDGASHRLNPVAAGDFRSRSGRGAATTAPVNIFYVVDLARYVLEGNPDRRINDPEIQKSYYYCASGLIAQSVYLFAASQGLAAWFHNCDKENTVKEFTLRPQQKVLFAQTVGYPA